MVVEFAQERFASAATLYMAGDALERLAGKVALDELGKVGRRGAVQRFDVAVSHGAVV